MATIIHFKLNGTNKTIRSKRSIDHVRRAFKDNGYLATTIDGIYTKFTPISILKGD